MERVDSGVGSDIKEGSFIKRTGSVCEDCDHELDVAERDRDDFICKRCVMRRRERKETIQEIVDTECSYGNDLTIIKQVRHYGWASMNPTLIFFHAAVWSVKTLDESAVN